MKIHAISRSPNVASSRLRSFYLFEKAAEHGIVVTRGDSIESWDFDVLHIQKKISLKILIHTIISRLLRKKIVFDIDDQPNSFRISSRNKIGELSVWSAFFIMILLSSITTVDTIERSKYWRKFGFRKIAVIPDVVDVSSERLSNINFKKNAIPEGSLELIWVGNFENFRDLAGIPEQAVKLGYNFTVVTNANSEQYFKINFPTLNFIPWSKDILFNIPLKNYRMILVHSIDSMGNYKSNNKMALSLAANILPIVSSTPSYKKLADAIGARDIVFDSVDDVFECIRRTDNDGAHLICSRGKELVLSRYSMDRNFSRFIRLLEVCCK